MNILWLPSMFPFPSDNGCKIVISNRMLLAKNAGYNIFTVVEGANISESAELQLKKLCKKYFIVPSIKRDRKYKLKWFITQSLNIGRYYNSEITDAIENILKTFSIDVIMIEMPMLAINLLPVWNKIGNASVIISQHNIESEAVASKIKVEGVSFLHKIYAKVESKKLFNWESKLYEKQEIKAQIFVTEEDLSKFTEKFPAARKQKFLCSPIGTNIPVSKKADNMKSPFSILFPAAFDYLPNIHGARWFANNVFPKILKKVPDARVVFAGRNPSEEVQSLACDNIIVTGTVSSMTPYFENATLFIVPLFFGGGMKTKLVEMGCYSKPTVTTSCGLVGTMYKKDIDVIVADEPENFANACIEILMHPEKYCSISNHMKETTEENYLWTNIGKKYVNFINTFVGE